MSLLIRSSLRRVTAVPAARAFSTSFVVRKSAVDTAKDAVKQVDKAVSERIVDGIEVGETATQKAKELAGMSTGELKGKAAEVKGEAEGKAAEVKGEAKGKVNEIKGKL